MSQGFWTTENPTTNLGVILKEAVEFWLRLRIGHLFLLRAKKHPSWLTILHVQIGWYRTYISDHISISETSTQWNIFPFVPWFSILFLDISQISTPRKTKKFQAKKNINIDCGFEDPLLLRHPHLFKKTKHVKWTSSCTETTRILLKSIGILGVPYMNWRIFENS